MQPIGLKVDRKMNEKGWNLGQITCFGAIFSLEWGGKQSAICKRCGIFLVYEFVSLSVDKLVSLIDIIAISKSFKVVKN